MNANILAARSFSLHTKLFVAATVCALALSLVPAPAHAAGLTQPQINAVLGLLSAFNVPAATIDNVRIILNGGSATETPVATLSCTLTANPSSVDEGQAVVLYWSSTGASYATWKQDGAANTLGLTGGYFATNGSIVVYANGKGSVSPTMLVTSTGGQTGTCKTTIKVDEQAGANEPYSLKASPVSGKAPLSVKFTIEKLNLSGTPVVYNLNFGDNSSSYSTSAVGKDGVTHVYSTPGSYVASLKEAAFVCAPTAVCGWPSVVISVTSSNTETPSEDNDDNDDNDDDNGGNDNDDSSNEDNDSGDDDNAPTVSSAKPNTAQFMAAAKTDSSTASSMLYGVIGSNTDVRDWGVIMSSANPLATARALTSAMYNSGSKAYLAGGATRPQDRSATVWSYTSGNFTFYKELIPGVGDNYILALVDANGYQLTSAANPDVLAKHITNFGFNKSDLAGLQAKLDAAGINVQAVTSWPKNFMSGVSVVPDVAGMMAAAAMVPLSAAADSFNMLADQVIEINYALAHVVSAYVALFSFDAPQAAAAATAPAASGPVAGESIVATLAYLPESLHETMTGVTDMLAAVEMAPVYVVTDVLSEALFQAGLY